MKKTILFCASLLALSSCDGPWNTYPADYTAPSPQLRVSLFVVGGRVFDTLWLERTQPLSVTYDSTLKFVESATIQVVTADDGSKVVGYSLVPGSAVAWVPDAQVKVVAGKSYRFTAHVVWNADKNWPAGKTVVTTDLVADAKVPDSWSIDSIVQVPVENLIPALSAGADVGDSLGMLVPLEKERPGTIAKWSFTSAMLDSLRQGLPASRPFRSGDSLWYISDSRHEVTNLDGKRVKRAYRNLIFRQRPGPDFGGVFALERWDVSRARVLDPIKKEFMKTRGVTGFKLGDSAGYYQAGGTRYGFGPYPAFAPGLFGWPNFYPFSNLTFGYTGPNTVYFYSVQQEYVIYQTQLASQAQGSTDAIPYTNVKGGSGYFTAALVDSFKVYIQATGVDTFSVEALRGAACRKAWKDHVSNGTGFDSLVACEGIDFRPSAK